MGGVPDIGVVAKRRILLRDYRAAIRPRRIA
jgi:hypothetical protein